MTTIKELQTKEWITIFNWCIAKNKANKNFLGMDPSTKFAYEALIDDKIVLSKMNFFQCARHLMFMYLEATDNAFPFTYRKAPLRKLIKFSSNIVVPEINKPFIFPPFRQFMAGFIFGWRLKSDTDKLITSEIFDIETRKQWKSSFWAMVNLAILCGFNKDLYPEIYISGPQRETSKIPYQISVNYLHKSPNIQPLFSVYNSLHIKAASGGIIKHLPFEKATLEGKNPSVVLLTEYHLHTTDTMQESARSSVNLSRKNQLIIYDTTKGHDTNSVCYKREQNYKDLLYQQILNPEKVYIVYDVFLWAAELDDEDYDNWKDPNLWAKANPNLGVSVTLEQLISEFNKIMDRPSMVEFQTKRAGMWAGQSNAYFELHQILKSDELTSEAIKPYLDEPSKLRSVPSILGIDLSAIHDTTHGVICFEIPQDDGESIWFFKGMGFIPEHNATLKEMSDKAQYLTWRDRGYCTLTAGKLIDYDYLTEWIKNEHLVYNMDKVAYDPWNFKLIKRYLLNKNLFVEDDIEAVPQGIRLSPIFKEFERKLLLNKVCFAGNQMLIRHMTNISIKEMNGTSNNIQIRKLSEKSRIDGFMAMLFAASLLVDFSDRKNDYNMKVLNI